MSYVNKTTTFIFSEEIYFSLEDIIEKLLSTQSHDIVRPVYFIDNKRKYEGIQRIYF